MTPSIFYRNFMVKNVYLLETQINSFHQILKGLVTPRESEPTGTLKTLEIGPTSLGGGFWE